MVNFIVSRIFRKGRAGDVTFGVKPPWRQGVLLYLTRQLTSQAVKRGVYTMHKKVCFTFLTVFLLFFALSFQTASAYSANPLLKKGMRNEEVRQLQQDLKTLGFFHVNPTGYFGSITYSSVINFQKRYGLMVDGIAGRQTCSKIDSLLGRAGAASRAAAPSRGNVQLLPWYDTVKDIFSIGSVAVVKDVDTGLRFTVKRTFGACHADVETVTAADTAVLRKIAGGNWNWERRAAIVEVKGYRIAASFTAMPHAGRDDKPALALTSGRSGGYGWGENYDAVKGNGIDGHFDIHFLGSTRHKDNAVDPGHKAMVQKAYTSGA